MEEVLTSSDVFPTLRYRATPLQGAAQECSGCAAGSRHDAVPQLQRPETSRGRSCPCKTTMRLRGARQEQTHPVHLRFPFFPLPLHHCKTLLSPFYYLICHSQDLKSYSTNRPQKSLFLFLGFPNNETFLQRMVYVATIEGCKQQTGGVGYLSLSLCGHPCHCMALWCSPP